ncbi:MAG: hypothetical protein ABIZ80_26165, partial [Bryobacteraceae bacterium]
QQAAFRKDLGGGSLLNESIIAAAEYMRSEPVRGRRAMVILTDNEPLNYQSPDDDVVRALYAADAVLNGIVLRKGSRPKAPKPGRATNPDFTPADVFGISERTGGECLEGKIGESFQQMMERLRLRYGLQYVAPSSEPGAFHRIRVELSPEARRKYPEAKVRAREGYYAIAQGGGAVNLPARN